MKPAVNTLPADIDPRLTGHLASSDRDRRVQFKRAVVIPTTLIAALLTYLLLPASMGELPRRMTAIFVIATVFWATEVIPLFATSLCIIGLEILLLANDGGLSGVGNIKYTAFLAPFSSGVIILFLGGLLLAAAVEKHGLDRAMAVRMLTPFFNRPVALVLAVLGLTAFFSMWISNTATTAMMLAIIAPIIAKMKDTSAYHRGLILAVPFGANIGGIGTPIGTPPNAVALAALRQAGYSISFIEWMLLGVPLMLLCLAACATLLLWFFPPDGERLEIRLDPPKKIDLRGKLTLWIMVIAIALWVTGFWHGVADPVIALLAAAALCALGVMGRKDVDSIDWNVLLLMWGGLSMGTAMQLTGLVDYIMTLPIAHLSGFLLAAVIVLISVVLGTFMSHTAATNLLVPIAMAFSAAERGQLVILAALASSFAMAMPVSTPPNALAFATGKIPAGPMIRCGTAIGLVCIVILLLGYQIMLPLFLNLDPPAAP